MASETIALVDELIKAKIPKKTATNLVDYIEKHQSQSLKVDIDLIRKDVNWLKWIVGIGFTFLITIMVYLHSDLKEDIKENRESIKQINQKLDRLLSK